MRKGKKKESHNLINFLYNARKDEILRPNLNPNFLQKKKSQQQMDKQI